jgi:hypothetical protein
MAVTNSLFMSGMPSALSLLVNYWSAGTGPTTKEVGSTHF